MKFSRRLNKLPKQFFASLVKNVNEAIDEGRDVINLGQGNPDQPTPEHIVRSLIESGSDPQSHKYPNFRGSAEFKEAVADFYMNEYGVKLDPQTEVAVLGGAKTGLVELPMILLNDGDHMLLPDPGYPDYLSGASLADVTYQTMPLLRENDFLPDYAEISDVDCARASLMYLNYPNNPTGATITREKFLETIEFARDNDITVVHDFAYGGIGFDGMRPISFMEIDGAKDVGIEIHSLSKSYNMAGWRIGFAVGNKEIIEAINIIQDHLFVSIFPAIQHAGALALRSSQECVRDLSDMYEGRRNALIRACRDIGWEVEAPKGSFFAWLKIPEEYGSAEFAEILLEKADLAVAPGVGFGEYGEGYVRVGLLVSEERFVEAIQRVDKLGLF